MAYEFDNAKRLKKELFKEKNLRINEEEIRRRIEEERHLASEGLGGRNKKSMGYPEATDRAKEIIIFERFVSDFLNKESIKGISPDDFKKIVEHLIVARNKGLIRSEEEVDDYLKSVIHSQKVDKDNELKLAKKIKGLVKTHFENKAIKAEERKIKELVLEIDKALSGRVSVGAIRKELEKQKTENMGWEEAAFKTRKKIIGDLKRDIEERRRRGGTRPLESLSRADEERIAADEERLRREEEGREATRRAEESARRDDEERRIAAEKAEEEYRQKEWKKIEDMVKEALEGEANSEEKAERILRALEREGITTHKAAKDALESGKILSKKNQRVFDDYFKENPHWAKRWSKGAAKWMFWKAPVGAAKGAGKAINKINIDITKPIGGFGEALFFVFLAYGFFLIDKYVIKPPFDGINVATVLSRFSDLSGDLILRILFNLFVVTALIWYIITQEFEWRDFLSFALLIFLTSVVISFGALNWGLYHFLMVYLLYFLYIGPKAEEKGKSRAYARYWMFGLLAFDYFGFGLLKHWNVFGLGDTLGNRYVFPLWPYVILWLKTKYNRHWFSTFALIALIVWTLVPFTYATFIADAGKPATQQQIGEAEAIARERTETIVDRLKQIYADAKQRYVRQLEYATGGYYEGQVEENENLPLGVYFEDVKASVKEFYEDEPVEVWGNLFVRTLDRDTPVTVDVGCEYEEGHVPANKVMPSKPFTIYTMEEEVIECRFDPKAIPTGTKKIKLKANFNFKTMAYLKSYVMDKDTLRTFRRDEIDVFQHYGIRDKSPIAVFTNGPVKIGMETNEPPIGLDENSTPYLGITIENQWSGNVNDIRDMMVQIPKGIRFFENCDNKFDSINTGEIVDPDYNTYVLNDRGRRYFKLPIKINEINYRSLRCLMQIDDKNIVLGDVPLTTKYFRTTVSYDYELMQEVSVNIRQAPRLTYFISGGTCNIGNDYGLVSRNIDRTELKNCGHYLDNFNGHHSNMVNKDKIDLLMVLSVAQKESSCNPDENDGIMQVKGIGRGHPVSEQIGLGVLMLDDTLYNAIKKENNDKNYGINDLDLLKFVLIGYNRGLSVALEAMRLYYGGMTIYDAMKNGCESFEQYQGKTDEGKYSLCTGRKEGTEEPRAYGAEYPNKVFGIYKNACEAMGGNYNEVVA